MHPSMRLKVTGDTFFLSDPEGAVFFRNNRGSFRMEGGNIDRWIEQLMPMWSGEHSMRDLTDVLPETHRDRVYEIAQTLLQNGYLRDVSRDRPSRLPRQVLEKYASQIDFLDSFGGSGAWRFEKYREARVLAAGSGPMLTALVSALLASGLPKFKICSVDAGKMNIRRITELAADARLADPEVDVQWMKAPIGVPVRWRDFVSSFDAVLWASSEEEINAFRLVLQACRLEKKWMLPALLAGQVGLAGPLASADTEGTWTSAWRRLHRKAVIRDPQQHAPSAVAESMLANVIVFELFKSLTGAAESELRETCWLLNLETLEAGRHPFLPHPAETGFRSAAKKLHLQRLRWPQQEVPDFSDGLLPFFQSLTSSVTGIFRQWDEGAYIQLPLSLCLVQPADPLSEGPAELLRPVLCGGLTHEEARREAGLAGVESYVSRWHENRMLTGIGAGETFAEGIGRALCHALQQELKRREGNRPPEGLRALPNPAEDGRCRFLIKALTLMGEEPEMAAGRPIGGLPVCYVKSGDVWHGAAGFTPSMALQGALVSAVMSKQAAAESRAPGTPVLQPALEAAALQQSLERAVSALERNGWKLEIFELAAEPFVKEKLSGVYGVALLQGGSA